MSTVSTDGVSQVMSQAQSSFTDMIDHLQQSLGTLHATLEEAEQKLEAYANRWPMEPGEYDGLRMIVRKTADEAEKRGISRASFITVTYGVLRQEAEVP